jgi:hypothetical protein
MCVFDCRVLIASHISVGQRTAAYVDRVEALSGHEIHAAENESPEGLYMTHYTPDHPLISPTAMAALQPRKLVNTTVYHANTD